MKLPEWIQDCEDFVCECIGHATPRWKAADMWIEHGGDLVFKIKQLMAENEQLTAERDYAITWVTYTHSAAERPAPADILTVIRSALTRQPSIESVIEDLRGET